MGRLIFTAILLAIVTPAAAQTADRLYLMDCGHNSAKDQARWSPGVNVGKPIELSDTCVLIKHRAQWLLWDTGYPDAVADRPVDTPVGHATRAKKLISQLGELKPSDIAFVAISHTHGDHVGNVDLIPDSTLLIQQAEVDCALPTASRHPSRRTGR
jgi:glyoxylase-like metal-dependent hydrolase (beta-lactamase superfamily II)